MFSGCSSLKDINLSNFDTNNVIDMSGMFYGCSSLNKINISKFKIKKNTNVSSMLYDCSSLKKNNIIIKDESIFKNQTIFLKGDVKPIS